MIAKKLALLVFAAVLCIGCFVGASAAEAAFAPISVTAGGNSGNDTIKYDFLPANEMPILGYFGPPPAHAGDADSLADNPSFMTRANFQRYVDAGFNILAGLYEREDFNTADIMKAMELCAEFGLAYFVNDNALRCDSDAGKIPCQSVNEYRQILQNAWYLNESAFAGIAVKDEPSAKDLDGMANVNAALKQVTSGKIVYTNLFPSMVETYRLYLDSPSKDAWESYVRYVTEYVDKVQPDVLAYDQYVFMKQDSSLENIFGDRLSQLQSSMDHLRDYIKTLSLYRSISLQRNIPFWVTVSSYNQVHRSQFTYKQTAWTVNTSLAYGAKGIQYFTYWSRIEGNKMEDWSTPTKSGLVTTNGTPHDTYYQIQQLNQHIKMVDDVLMQCVSKGVMQFGKQTLQMVPDDTLYSYGMLNNISGGDAFVGCFDCNGRDVYYVVNNSTTAGRQTFKADFLTGVNVRLTNLDGVVEYHDAYSVGFNLSGGQAVLLEVL